MRIQDIEVLCGMDRATIRFYEKEGFINPVREENGYRSYSDDDVRLLLKIKLLRKLGMSLQKIKALQQGSEDFSDVLLQQIEMLEAKIGDDTAAKNVCVEMQRSRVNYQTLDTQKYLGMLGDHTDNTSRFKEEIAKEHHPWRRYFARMLDYALLSSLLQFVLVMIIGVRPYSRGLQLVVQYGSYLLSVPILALFISKWGITPGKWVMGIYLESYEREKLDFESAFSREKCVIWYGFGFFIPFYELWRLYMSYKKDIEGEKNEWNCDTEITFTEWKPLKKAGFAIIFLITMLLNVISSTCAVMPHNRYDQMIVSQFAKNYNIYTKIVDIEDHLMLDNNGKWTYMVADGVRIEIGEDIEYVRPEFEYTLDGQIINAVAYQETWENESFIANVIPSHCVIAMYTMVGSRPGAGYQEMRQLDDLIKELRISVEKGSSEGNRLIGDVLISWDLQLSNWAYAQNGMLIASSNNTIYKLNICLEVQQS